jgi:hypothetical protein
VTVKLLLINHRKSLKGKGLQKLGPRRRRKSLIAKDLQGIASLSVHVSMFPCINSYE